MNESLVSKLFGKRRHDPGPIASRTAGRVRLRQFSSWPLTIRVLAVSTALSLIAVFVVGAFVSASVSDALYEQRRDRSLSQAKLLRDTFVNRLDLGDNATDYDKMVAIANFVDTAATGDPSVFKGVALTPAPVTDDEFTVTSNNALRAWVGVTEDEEYPYGAGEFRWRNVEYLVRGSSQPAVLVSTRAQVGEDTYELVFLFSMQPEIDTIDEVTTILISSGLLMLVLNVVIALGVSALVANPLRRAAVGAERIAQGELHYRVPIRGGDDLARVGTSFNDMAASLEQKIDDLVELSKVQQRFVSDVSHELRTPLTTIKMATTVLASESNQFSAPAQRTTTLLGEQLERFQMLLDDLLEMTRFDAGGAQLEGREAVFEDSVSHTIELLRPIIEQHGAIVNVRHRSGKSLAYFDERRIERIVRNLLTNAIEHRGTSPVWVETAASERAVSLTVCDGGVGLTKEEAAHVFDRFWRADPSRRRTLGGTGLGLAICKEDAELHGGALEVVGEKGRGALFRLTIPREHGKPMGAPPLPLILPSAQ